MKLDQLPINEYADFYASYINALENVELLDTLEISLHEFIRFVREIPLDKYDYRYAEGKWTIRDIIQHLIDSERVFSYRALRFARKDRTPLPGFDENFYAGQVNTEVRSIQSLLAEMSTVRESTLSLFRSFSQEQLQETGIASDKVISVRALGFIIVGHQKHHQKVFQERYL
jgi:uncharacterized damage-inducible protein DinB